MEFAINVILLPFRLILAVFVVIFRFGIYGLLIFGAIFATVKMYLYEPPPNYKKMEMGYYDRMAQKEGFANWAGMSKYLETHEDKWGYGHPYWENKDYNKEVKKLYPFHRQPPQ